MPILNHCLEHIQAYEDAVKRAPKNATIRNNLAAALCKVMDFNGAKREIEKALDLDPKYVKAWARKADIEVLMKENHKAMESYKKGLALDPSNKSCREGLQKVMTMVNQGSANMTECTSKRRLRGVGRGIRLRVRRGGGGVSAVEAKLVF